MTDPATSSIGSDAVPVNPEGRRMPWLPEGRTVVVDGRGEFFVRVHRHPDPSRPWVLLLHGWTASSDLQFFTAYERLAERYSFVGIDHRGHGRGLRSEVPFALEDVADDAAAVCEALGIDEVITVGYSMGGPISLFLARRHPELVRAMVVQATALEWRATWHERLRFRLVGVVGAVFRSHRFRKRMSLYAERSIDEHNAHLRPYLRWFVAEITRNDPVAMVEAGRALAAYDARPWASALGRPAAMLITTRDRLVRPRKQRALAEALRASVREVDADHTVTMTHPHAFAERTVQLVADVEAASHPSDPPALGIVPQWYPRAT